MLVAVSGRQGREQVVGFVHVLDLGQDRWHVDQLVVAPEHTRRGHGRALLRAGLARAWARGARRITLMTFADVPFNGPFYASEGFVEFDPAPHWLDRFVAAEERLGMARWGRRIAMTHRG